MVRPSTAPAQSLRQAGRRLTASRFGLETDLDYAENDQPVNKNKNKRDIIEDFDEEDEEIDQDDDSSVSVHQGSRLKSSDLKGQLQALRDEHEEMKRDYESLQDKVKSLEDDLKASQMQNKAQKLELNMLNTLLEVNKQAILKPLGSDSKTTIETDPDYYKRKYEEQLELTYGYLDEIQRLQRIVDDFDIEGGKSEEIAEDNPGMRQNGNHVNKAKPSHSRRSSRCSNDFEEIKEGGTGNPRNKDIKSKIQNNLNRKIVHIKIKADEVGMDAILSKTVTKATPTTQKTIEVGKQAPIAKMVTPQEKKAILKQKTIDNDDQDRMSNASKLSQGSAALSAANRRVALNRKVNPILQPITSKQLDINSSKHSFSANNSVASEHEGDEVTLDEIEQLLSTTQTNLSEFTKEFKVITNSIMGQAPHSQPTKGFVLAKPDSGKGTRVTSNLDSMLTTTAINPIPKTASKVGFSIKSNRPQRSLSRNKK